jgi:hypothetical protein
LITKISGHPHALTAIIKTEDTEGTLIAIELHGSIAVPVNTVKAHTELLVVSESASDIDMRAYSRSRSITGRELR